MVKKVENKFGAKNDSIYKILEKPKKIEDIIERELNRKEKENTDYKKKIYLQSNLHLSEIRIKVIKLLKKF